MRYIALVSVLIGTLALASPVQAGAGLPKLASFTVGEISATVQNDSPTLKTGTNVLTLQISELPEGYRAELTLVGPAGQSVPVPLKPLVVLEGPAEAHGDDGHGAEESAAGHDAPKSAAAAPAKSDGHGGDSHGTPAPAPAKTDDHESSDGHGDEDALGEAGYNARGKVRLSETGEWKLIFALTDDHGAVTRSEAHVPVEQGGPNRLFLAVTGSLMGGTMIYGAIERRRQHGR